jgi:uncharacterized protein (TIGR02646 family)
MIFINKAGHPVPNILLTDGVAKRQEHIDAFIADEANFRLNTRAVRKFPFDKTIYGAATVKTSLENIQNNKCCFCEAKYKHVTSGDVEHFRPKAGFSQGKGKNFIRPGYFWLAYDWDNLLVSCEVCNRRNKGSYFPLSNPGARFTSYNSNIDIEHPWFINPSSIDPEYHITFYKEVPTHTSFQGAKTISYLSLDRQELNEMRLSKFNGLKALEECYKVTIGYPMENTTKDIFFNRLREVLLNNGEYYSMVKSNFGKYIPQL